MTGRATIAVVAGAAALLPGCGGDDDLGALRWQRQPRVERVPGLPRDRVLHGRLLNDSREPVRLRASALVLRDAGGSPLAVNVAFRDGVRGLLERGNRGDRLSGTRDATGPAGSLRLAAGATAPITLVWRQGPTIPAPRRLEYGSGRLPLPPR